MKLRGAASAEASPLLQSRGLGYTGGEMCMNEHKVAFKTSVSDPSFAAMLVTLGFPLRVAPRETVAVDLHGQAGGEKRAVAWHFAPESVTRPGLSYSEVCGLWGAPHATPSADERPHDVVLCKRALHNYRVLLTQVHHNGGLHCGVYGCGCRLSSWPAAGYEGVPHVEAAEVPLGTPASQAADVVAVAVTLGVPVQSSTLALGRWCWQLGRPLAVCPWTAAEILGLAGDEEYLRRHEDPPAVLHALFYNRRALAKMQAAAEARTLVLSKRGRYAVVSSGADEARLDDALRHLNV